MSQVNPIVAETGQETNSCASKGANESTPAGGLAQGNGVMASSVPATESSADPVQRPVMKRAEALADRLALQLGVVSTVVAESLKRFVARAREEAEDLWAEAQHIRKGTKP